MTNTDFDFYEDGKPGIKLESTIVEKYVLPAGEDKLKDVIKKISDVSTLVDEAKKDISIQVRNRLENLNLNKENLPDFISTNRISGFAPLTSSEVERVVESDETLNTLHEILSAKWNAGRTEKIEIPVFDPGGNTEKDLFKVVDSGFGSPKDNIKRVSDAVGILNKAIVDTMERVYHKMHGSLDKESGRAEMVKATEASSSEQSAALFKLARAASAMDTEIFNHKLSWNDVPSKSEHGVRISHGASNRLEDLGDEGALTGASLSDSVKTFINKIKVPRTTLPTREELTKDGFMDYILRYIIPENHMLTLDAEWGTAPGINPVPKPKSIKGILVNASNDTVSLVVSISQTPGTDDSDYLKGYSDNSIDIGYGSRTVWLNRVDKSGQNEKVVLPYKIGVPKLIEDETGSSDSTEVRKYKITISSTGDNSGIPFPAIVLPDFKPSELSAIQYFESSGKQSEEKHGSVFDRKPHVDMFVNSILIDKDVSGDILKSMSKSAEKWEALASSIESLDKAKHVSSKKKPTGSDFVDEAINSVMSLDENSIIRDCRSVAKLIRESSPESFNDPLITTTLKTNHNKQISFGNGSTKEVTKELEFIDKAKETVSRIKKNLVDSGLIKFSEDGSFSYLGGENGFVPEKVDTFKPIGRNANFIKFKLPKSDDALESGVVKSLDRLRSILTNKFVKNRISRVLHDTKKLNKLEQSSHGFRGKEHLNSLHELVSDFVTDKMSRFRNETQLGFSSASSFKTIYDTITKDAESKGMSVSDYIHSDFTDDVDKQENIAEMLSDVVCMAYAHDNRNVGESTGEAADIFRSSSKDRSISSRSKSIVNISEAGLSSAVSLAEILSRDPSPPSSGVAKNKSTRGDFFKNQDSIYFAKDVVDGIGDIANNPSKLEDMRSDILEVSAPVNEAIHILERIESQIATVRNSAKSLLEVRRGVDRGTRNDGLDYDIVSKMKSLGYSNGKLSIADEKGNRVSSIPEIIKCLASQFGNDASVVNEIKSSSLKKLTDYQSNLARLDSDLSDLSDCAESIARSLGMIGRVALSRVGDGPDTKMCSYSRVGAIIVSLERISKDITKLSGIDLTSMGFGDVGTSKTETKTASAPDSEFVIVEPKEEINTILNHLERYVSEIKPMLKKDVYRVGSVSLEQAVANVLGQGNGPLGGSIGAVVDLYKQFFSGASSSNTEPYNEFTKALIVKKGEKGGTPVTNISFSVLTLKSIIAGSTRFVTMAYNPKTGTPGLLSAAKRLGATYNKQ